ncbi:hypothetical protein AJ79_01444 [Helicocarpus griseus UAMH5409]|uniref:Uncharacterized protein n=1 Tax=Helicocarpus griseus UAMH5409 TaxID=1447875 RepID=A0A2B7Y6F9_9EURO|nr:hypothetical protein AJ79_01444 [Helicocarpus griseus UAMH5409]
MEGTSPLLAGHELPTPLDSPRKRRRAMRESDETEGDMTIENYIYRSDPYRSTTLPNTSPWPLDLEDAPHLQERLRPLEDEVRKILDKHGFPKTADFLPYVASKRHYPGGTPPVNLLLVWLRADDYTPKELSPARDEFSQLFQIQNILDMHVEICNRDLCFYPSLFPLRPDHEIIKSYERAKGRIVDVVHERLKTHWKVVCPFSIGRTEPTALPAFVVIVEPQTFCELA